MIKEPQGSKEPCVGGCSQGDPQDPGVKDDPQDDAQDPGVGVDDAEPIIEQD